MNIKERFTVYRHSMKGYPLVVVDNKTGSVITEMQAEDICQEEYGQQFSDKAKYISEVINYMISNIEKYNKMCIDGFQITKRDLMSKINSNKNLPDD